MAQYLKRNKKPYVELEGGEKTSIPRYYKKKLYTLKQSDNVENDFSEQLTLKREYKKFQKELEKTITEFQSKKVQDEHFQQQWIADQFRKAEKLKKHKKDAQNTKIYSATV